MSPVIGISSYHRDGDVPAFSLPCSYIDAIRAVGATPLVLPPGEAEPSRLLAVLDGLILAGGGDIDPSHYGGDVHQTNYMVSAERDRFELDLVFAALKEPSLPLLCICRGAQVLNVALGGSLFGHIPDVFGERVLHRLPPRLPTRHPVRVEPGSRLARLLAADDVEVCSWHHQSIDRVGEGLKPVAWSSDGVIEAVESVGHSFCVGVQWHPEMQFQEASQLRLFEHFAVAAAQRQRHDPQPQR